MRAAITSPRPVEPRYRSSASLEETSKRKSQRNRDHKDLERAVHNPTYDKYANCKIPTLKLVLFVIICGTYLTLFHFPSVHTADHIADSGSKSTFVEKWTSQSPNVDPRYVSSLVVDWDDVSVVVEKLTDRSEYQGIGILNFHNSELDQWRQILPNGELINLHLDYAPTNVTWDSLYPEWIDEEEDFEIPVCPSLPSINAPAKPRIDLIAVKLPCMDTKNWTRDVARLHLQLAATRLASMAKSYHPLHVLYVTKCFPIPNLITQKELIAQKGNVWLYEPNLNILREKVRLPVGSCELAVSLKAKENFYSGRAHREAYATILHSAHVYVCGAIAAAQSIRMSGSTRDLVILVDDSISDHHKEGLEAAGWKIHTIQRIRNPKAEKDAYNEWNYSKFRLWQLTEYDKIIFIDADMLILRNIDFLFEMPEISATGNNGTLFNSGVMVIEPSNTTFQLLMDHIYDIESYNGGDQGYLNEIFTWWHRIPKHMNFLKHFWEGDEEEKKEFASDVAHETWWRVHDAMPQNLQQFCLLRSKQKAALEWDRRQAEKGNYTDGHWKIKIKDRRLKSCFEKFCYWESMLWHWGETNWTDNATTSAHVPAASKTVNLSSL
uniref:Hexosyltransferase n=1 Tax=Kalanchoe fedtschenkoi TaxID=63787 RepID=A0A7N0ZZD0_KALFE